jgi:hypothetical protein
MARAMFVKKAQKDIERGGQAVVKKGESYWWWKFRFGSKHVSKDRPRRAQLTQSSFLSELYTIEDEIEATLPSDDSLGSSRDEMVSSLQSLLDQCQESLDNMPEHLQESSESGILLQERIDALVQWISDLEGVDCEIEPDDDETDEEKYQSIVDEIQGLNPGVS